MNGFKTPYVTLIGIDGKQIFHDGIHSLREPLLYVSLTFHTQYATISLSVTWKIVV